jgi:hypothetical protein
MAIMQDLSARFKIMPAFFAVALLFVFGCDSGAPPPSPPASADTSEDAEGKTKAKSKTLSKSEELDDEETKNEEEEAKRSAFNFGGAKIGEKEVVDALEKCLESGKFYNRFDEDETLGKCTKLSLANVDCDSKGLKKVLSDKQLEQFNTALADDTSSGYKGWTIDQCLDCKKGSDEALCQNSSGKEQVGTKIFFLQVADSETKGKSMVLPVRPGQD